MNHKNTLIFLLFCILTACVGNEKSQNNFETGKKHEEMQRYDSATLYYRKAIDLLNEKEDSPLKGEIYNRLGDIFIQTSLYPNAYETYKKASEYNSDLEDKANLSKSLRGMGKSCVLQNKLDSALTYFLSAFKLSESIKDTSELLLINNNLSNIYLDLKQYDKSLYYNNIALALAKDSIDFCRSWLSKGDIFTEFRQLDSAWHYYKLGSLSTDIYTKAACYWGLSMVSTYLQSPDSSKYLKLFLMLNDSLDKCSQTVQVQNADYEYVTNKSANTHKNILLYVLIIFLLSLLVFMILIERHKKRLKIEKQQREKETAENEITLSRLHEEMMVLQAKVESKEKDERLMEIRKSIIENIKRTALRSRENFMKSDKYRLIKEKFNKAPCSVTKDEQKNIIRAVTGSYATFIRQLTTFVDINADDCFLCCLSLSKFTPKESSVLRKASWSAVRFQKNKIKNEIEKTFSSLELYEFIFD